MAAKFVVYLDRSKRFRFRFLAGNGEIVASGEAYDSKASCLNGIKSIQKNAPGAAIVDETVKKEEKKVPAKKSTKKTAVKKAAPKKAPKKLLLKK
jgi:uncharacterized protein YegP (UPF0339 family)